MPSIVMVPDLLGQFQRGPFQGSKRCILLDLLFLYFADWLNERRLQSLHLPISLH